MEPAVATPKLGSKPLDFTAKRERALRERAEGTVQQHQARDSAADLEARFTRASTSWEDRVKATDADWQRKEPFIVEAITAAVRLRQPTTEQEVVDLCQRAYDQVTRIMRSSAPTRSSVNPAVGGSTTTTKVVPKTSLEAARLAIGA